MSIFSSIGKLFGLGGGGGSSAPSGLYGTEEHKRTQAQSSYENYKKWSGEIDARYAQDMAYRRARTGASGGSIGSIDMIAADATKKYERERETLDAGASKKYLNDYYGESVPDGSAEFGQSQEDFYQDLFGNAEEAAVTETETAGVNATRRAQTAASGRAAGTSPWMIERTI